MRSVWYGLGLAAATAFVLAGCATSEPSKIPKHPDEYQVPPVEDARYSQPPAFPKNMLNTDRVPTGSTAQPKLGQRMPGMNGPGN